MCSRTSAVSHCAGAFLVDTSGVVRFAEVNQPGEARDQEAWKKALAVL